jgi:hypothetical protein
MAEVSIAREVPVAATAVRSALRSVLKGLCELSRTGELSLAVRLAGRDGATLAEVAVPVNLSVGKTRRGEDPSIPLEVKPRGPGGLFPVFSGWVEVREREPALTELELRGAYEAPLGVIGVALDATGLRGAAQQSLSALLDRIVDAINDRLGRDAERERRQSRW